MTKERLLVPLHTDSKKLARAIFRAELPEETVRRLPAQSLYMALKSIGIESAQGLLEIVTQAQYSAMLDFELWERDNLCEENFWNWLAAIDDDSSFDSLGKFLASLDLKIVSLLISRYTETFTFEEPTDEPPGPLFYTPDKGFSWIQIKLTDPDRHRLFGKILAFLFETNVRLFYQLLSIPKVSTETELEEESYQDKLRRLADEGIPELEQAIRINSGITLDQLKSELQASERHLVPAPVTKIVEPLIYEPEVIQPFTDLCRAVQTQGADLFETFEAELTQIMNGGIVAYSVPFYAENEVLLLAEKVRGAINIGLQKCAEITKDDLFSAYRNLGLENIYRAGLQELRELRKFALSFPNEIVAHKADDQILVALLAGAREPFPVAPAFLRDDGSLIETEDGRLSSDYRAISNLICASTIRLSIRSRLEFQ